MDESHPRLSSVFEWVVAAAFLLATAAVAWLIVAAMRDVGGTPVRAREPKPPAAQPASVPSGAISVPALILLDGTEVRVGDSLRQVTDRVGRGTDVEGGAEKGRLGERVARGYERGGTHFILVFEPFERNGEPRVTAIYLH